MKLKETIREHNVLEFNEKEFWGSGFYKPDLNKKVQVDFKPQKIKLQIGNLYQGMYFFPYSSGKVLLTKNKKLQNIFAPDGKEVIEVFETEKESVDYYNSKVSEITLVMRTHLETIRENLMLEILKLESKLESKLIKK